MLEARLRPRRFPRVPPARTEDEFWKSDVEKTLIELSIKMDFLVAEAREQAIFRQRVYWLGLTGLGLLILQSLGFDVSVVK